MASSPKPSMLSFLRHSGMSAKKAITFQVDLTIEIIEGVRTGPHKLKWTRGSKTMFSETFQTENRSASILEIGETLSLVSTLYKSKTHSVETPFDPKDSKLSLLSQKEGRKHERTIGKVNFNLADYVGIPSASNSVNFRLNSKVTVQLRMDCTVLHFVQKVPRSAASRMSSLTSLSREREGEALDNRYTPAESFPFMPGERLCRSVVSKGSGEDAFPDSEVALSPMTPEPNGTFAAVRIDFEPRGDSRHLKPSLPLERANRAVNVSHQSLHANEDCYREQLKSVQEELRQAETKASATEKSFNLTVFACRKELEQKDEELELMQHRVDSLKTDLVAKEKVNENLVESGRQREVELGNMRHQTLQESVRSGQLAEQLQSLEEGTNSQLEQYCEEMNTSKAAERGLRQELSHSLNQADIQLKRVEMSAHEIQQAREVAQERNLVLESKLNEQNSLVALLQEKLLESANTNHKVAQEYAIEKKRNHSLVEEKSRLEDELRQSGVKVRQQDLRVCEIQARIREMGGSMEELELKTKFALEDACGKVGLQQNLLLGLQRENGSLQQRLKVHKEKQSRVMEVRAAAFKCARYLGDENQMHAEALKATQQKLALTEKHAGLQRGHITHWKSKAMDFERRAAEADSEVKKLQETIHALRTQVSVSTKSVLVGSASEPDPEHPNLELEGRKDREQLLSSEVGKKFGTSEERKAKLTESVCKHATDMAYAEAQIAKAKEFEKGLREELVLRKAKVDELENEVISFRSSNELKTKTMEGEVQEALNREEHYKDELTRLRKALQKMKGTIREEKGKASSAARKVNSGSNGDGVHLREGGLRAGNIRSEDLFEKITDVKLLQMLIETKMELAMTTEENLMREHLLARVQDGDEHVTKKVRTYGALLGLRMSNQMNEASSHVQLSENRSRSGMEKLSEYVLARARRILRGNQEHFACQQESKDMQSVPIAQRGGKENDGCQEFEKYSCSRGERISCSSRSK